MSIPCSSLRPDQNAIYSMWSCSVHLNPFPCLQSCQDLRKLIRHALFCCDNRHHNSSPLILSTITPPPPGSISALLTYIFSHRDESLPTCIHTSMMAKYISGCNTTAGSRSAATALGQHGATGLEDQKQPSSHACCDDLMAQSLLQQLMFQYVRRAQPHAP